MINAARLESFSVAYHTGLTKAVTENPENYMLARGETPEAYVTRTHHAMMSHIEKGKAVNMTNSAGFRNACKTLGIKYTVKSILAFIAGE